MQNQIPPLLLTFGASDPVGALGIQADLASFSAMGCHGLSVITSILIGDTTRIEDIQAIEPEYVAAQARVVLEDMAVSAFKVGLVGSVDNISAIAEIVADYPDIPLILDPFLTAAPSNNIDGEDVLIAIRELLLPQTTLLLASAAELNLLAETWREPVNEEMLTIDALRVIEMGCEFLLVTGTPTDALEVANTLFGATGVVRQDNRLRLAGSFTGAASTLSAATAALLSCGFDVPEAIVEAQEFTVASLAHAQRLGMGKLVPNRYFWAHELKNNPRQ